MSPQLKLRDGRSTSDVDSSNLGRRRHIQARFQKTGYPSNGYKRPGIVRRVVTLEDLVSLLDVAFIDQPSVSYPSP